MNLKNKDENAKNKDFKVPVNLPSTQPEKYELPLNPDSKNKDTVRNS